MANGLQMTLQEYDPTLFQTQTSIVSDFLAKLSVLQETEEDSKIQEVLSSLKSCGLLKKNTLQYCSVKMLRDSLIMVGGGTFGVLLNALEDLGYGCEWMVLNSRYFGVAQNRERVFLVGHLGDFRGREVFPLATDHPKADELQGHKSDYISNTLCAGKRDMIGIYPIIGGGIVKVNGYHKK